MDNVDYSLDFRIKEKLRKDMLHTLHMGYIHHTPLGSSAAKGHLMSGREINILARRVEDE
jgi:hypothetical protein